MGTVVELVLLYLLWRFQVKPHWKLPFRLYDSVIEVLKGGTIMPKATVDRNYREKVELKSCPGGWVELRRMSYGEYLRRRDIMTNMKFQGEGDQAEAVMEAANTRVTQYEFKICITDHNLEDGEENQLNFAAQRAIQTLDPRIGNEIADAITKMNEFERVEEEQGLGNSEAA